MRSHTARVKWLVAICEDTARLMESRPTEEWLYWGCSFFMAKRFSVTCAVAFGFTSKTGRRDLLSLSQAVWVNQYQIPGFGTVY